MPPPRGRWGWNLNGLVFHAPRQDGTVFHFLQEPGVSPPSFTDKSDARYKLTWAEEAMSKGEAAARARQHPTARRPGLG